MTERNQGARSEEATDTVRLQRSSISNQKAGRCRTGNAGAENFSASSACFACANQAFDFDAARGFFWR